MTKQALNIVTWAIAALVSLAAFSCGQGDELDPTPKWVEYKVRAGRHDFTPSPLPVPLSASSMEGAFALDSSCWYNNLGVDNADWNKLIGIFQYWDLRKNKNSFLIAWRPHLPQRGVFELCLYENIQGKNLAHEAAPVLVRAGHEINWRMVPKQGKYSLFLMDKPAGQQENPLQYKTVGIASAWFGGNREAPKDMKIRMWMKRYDND